MPLFPQFPGIRKGGDKEDKKQQKWISGHGKIRRPAKPPTKPGQKQGSASASKAQPQLQEGSPALLLTQTMSSGLLLQKIKIHSGSICPRPVSVNTSPTNQGPSGNVEHCSDSSKVTQGSPVLSSISSLHWDTFEPNSCLKFKVHRAVFNNPTKHFVSTENKGF